MTVDRYLELALLPDVEGLAEFVLAAVEQDGPLPVYDRLLQPALEEVGSRWSRDELTVADEHLVTALTEQVLARMRPRRVGGPRAVVACTPANEHRVGATMVADTLRLAGWDALVLGARTPVDDLAELCLERDARLVALSVGIEEELDVLAEELTRLRDRMGPDVRILVGGGAIRRSTDWVVPDGVTTCSSVGGLFTLVRAETDTTVSAP